MSLRELLTLAIAAMLPGCAGRIPAAAPMGAPDAEEAYSWHFKTTAESGLRGPIAVYGPPETIGFLAFLCDPENRVIEYLEFDGEPFAAHKPFAIEAGATRWSGFLSTESPDAIVIRSTAISSSHPIVEALRSGSTPIRLTDEAGSSDISNDPAVSRVIDECRGG